MLGTKNFKEPEIARIVSLLALIAWKIELKEFYRQDRAMKMAINTTLSAARNFAGEPFEKNLCDELQKFLEILPLNEGLINEFNRTHSLREPLREVVKLFLTQAENREVRSFTNFLYRFASRLTEVSGKSFAGMGRRLDAAEAEILLEIRDELPG